MINPINNLQAVLILKENMIYVYSERKRKFALQNGDQEGTTPFETLVPTVINTWETNGPNNCLLVN